MRARRRGQSVTEVVIVYGDEVRKAFGDSSGSLAGETSIKRSGYPGTVNEKHNMGNVAQQDNPECAGGACTYSC